MNGLHVIQKNACLCALSKLKKIALCSILLAYVALLSPAQSQREFTFENGQLAHVMEANDSCELAIPAAMLGMQAGAYNFPILL